MVIFFMKNFLGVLILILIFQIPSHADYINHIQKFKIEGISVGDSLLDHFSEEQIKDNDETLTRIRAHNSYKYRN